jgi:hypothetical protein
MERRKGVREDGNRERKKEMNTGRKKVWRVAEVKKGYKRGIKKWRKKKAS